MSLLQNLEAELVSYRLPVLQPVEDGYVTLRWLMKKLEACGPLSVLGAALGVARVELDTENTHILWQPSPAAAEDKLGGPAIVLPVYDADGVLVDLLALHPDDSAHYWQRSGVGRVLGLEAMREAAKDGAPLRVFETPMEMLRAYAVACDGFAERRRQARARLAEMVPPGDAAFAGPLLLADQEAEDAATNAALIEMLKRHADALSPPRLEAFGCCLLPGGYDDIEFTLGRAATLVVDNPAFGLELDKALASARSRRRRLEPPLPAVLNRQDKVLMGWQAPQAAQ